jgi:hypothetical protein
MTTQNKTTGSTNAEISSAENAIIRQIGKVDEWIGKAAIQLADHCYVNGHGASFSRIAERTGTPKGTLHEWARFGLCLIRLKAGKLRPMSKLAAAKAACRGFDFPKDLQGQRVLAFDSVLRNWADRMENDPKLSETRAANLANPVKKQTRKARPGAGKATASAPEQTEEVKAPAKETPEQTVERLRAQWVQAVNKLDADGQAKAREAMENALSAWA